MEDKRPLLTIVLILVVFLGFNYYQATQRQARLAEQESSDVVTPEPAETGAATPVAVADEARAEAADAPPESFSQPAETSGAAYDEEITVVDTPTWVARFSNRGATVLSWSLKEYSAFSGEPVDMVSGEEGALGVEFLFGAERLDTASWMFEGPGAVELHPRGDGAFSVLGFRAEREDGVRVVKEYTVYADSYTMELYVNVIGLDGPAA